MRYAGPPSGASNDPYLEPDINLGTPGSQVSALAIEQVMRELEHLIVFAGLTPDFGNLEQVREAIDLVIAAVSSFEVGDIKWSAQPTPDATFVACDGAVISRAGFPELFALIGETFGPGDGSTTFAIPDLRGRTAIVSGQGQGNAVTLRTIGEQVGVETVTLDVNTTPNHRHFYFRQPRNGEIIVRGAVERRFAIPISTTGVNGHSEAIGVALPHNNMQPTRALKAYLKASP